MIGNKPIDIEIVYEAEPQLALPTSFFQIAMTNLIRNAIQYTTSGKISIVIKEDRILVTDTGAGMVVDDLKHTTGQHFTGDSDESFGLGLFIVQRLCNRFGWKLNIESETDCGTTVELIFRSP